MQQFHERKTSASADSRQLAIRQEYAPDNSGFLHTMPTRFTYFEGSQTGTRTTFGMEHQEITRLFREFAAKQAAAHKELKLLLTQCLNQIETLNREYEQGSLYNRNDVIAQGVVNTGHIPIILSAINPAGIYNRAARSIRAQDVELYFTSMPTDEAVTQASLYLVKQMVMSSIAELNRNIRALRQSVSQRDDQRGLFYACNAVLKALQTDVIAPNQQSMPNQYVEFDLLQPFRETVYALICKIDKRLIPESSINALLNSISGAKDGETCFYAQERITNTLYSEIQTILAKPPLGITKDFSGAALTEQQDAMLQAILPLIAYLNSEFSPFARNGVFGDMASTPFHSKALEEYRSHESQEFAVYKNYSYTPQIDSNPTEFNAEQMEQLLFGKNSPEQAPAAQGFFSSMQRALMGMLTSSATAAPTSSTQDSRRTQLALPVPPKYLAIEAPPAPPAPEDGASADPRAAGKF